MSPTALLLRVRRHGLPRVAGIFRQRGGQRLAAVTDPFLFGRGKAHLLPTPGGQDQKRALPALCPLAQDGVPCLA